MSVSTSAFACYNRKESERGLSSSGGIYPLIAKYIIQEHGVVFAVCYDDCFETVHSRLESLEDIAASQGSKYIPSKLGDTFLEVRECLDEGREVLFVGTPCQCAGLRSYLNGREYGGLICVDFVCHGVPSRSAYRSYLCRFFSEGRISQLNMRDKSSGWSGYQYSWDITLENGKSVTVPQGKVSFMRGFVQDYYLRPSCYECRFKGVNRITDITLGDYWGVWDIQPDMDDNRGTSLVLVHTDKGMQLFHAIEDQMVWKEAPLAEAVRHNPSMIQSAELTDKRKRFFDELDQGREFDKIIETLSEVTLIEKVKRKGKRMVKKFLGGGD